MSSVIEKKPETKTLREQLQSEGMKRHLAMALPKHMTPDRMVRVALTTMTRTPKLADCEPASFFKALFECSQMGLEPDGRRAHLIPFENKRRGVVECQLIVDYKGLAELAFRSGRVKSIHAQEVRDGDLFEVDRGQVTKHIAHAFRRDPAKPESAGEVWAFYCIVEMDGNAHKCEVMSQDEVNAIRDNSQGYKSAKKYNSSSPWIDHPIEMGKKTVFRRASKWLPLSAEYRIAAAHDDDGDVVDSVATQAAGELQTILAAGVPMLGDSVMGDDGEITPFDAETINTRFAGCITEQAVKELYRELSDAYPDQDAALASMADDRAETIKRRKKGDGTLPMNG